MSWVDVTLHPPRHYSVLQVIVAYFCGYNLDVYHHRSVQFSYPISRLSFFPLCPLSGIFSLLPSLSRFLWLLPRHHLTPLGVRFLRPFRSLLLSGSAQGLKLLLVPVHTSTFLYSYISRLHINLAISPRDI